MWGCYFCCYSQYCASDLFWVLLLSVFHYTQLKHTARDLLIVIVSVIYYGWFSEWFATELKVWKLKAACQHRYSLHCWHWQHTEEVCYSVLIVISP